MSLLRFSSATVQRWNEDTKLTVWNQQDWAWRLVALLGIAAMAALLVLWTYLRLIVPILQAPDELLRWTQFHSHLFVRAFLAFAAVWLAMLLWRQGAWLWGAVWVALGLVFITWSMDFGLYDVAPHSENLPLLFLLSAIVASQLWLAHEACSTSRKSLAAIYGGSADKIPTLWRRATLPWQLLASAGGIVAVMCAAAWPWTWGIEGPSSIAPPQAPMDCHLCLAALATAITLILVSRSLVINGRSWLFWLLLWALCIPGSWGMLASGPARAQTLGSKFPFILDDLQQPVGQTALAALFLLLALSQIWVALKARQLQSGQVGLAAH